MKTPLIKTDKRAIAVVADEGSKSYDQTIQEMEGVIGRIIKGRESNTIVLIIVLKEMMKIRKGGKIGFDFGGKKVFELKRIK